MIKTLRGASLFAMFLPLAVGAVQAGETVTYTYDALGRLTVRSASRLRLRFFIPPDMTEQDWLGMLGASTIAGGGAVWRKAEEFIWRCRA